MIKTAFKHFLGEICIETLFNGIADNFAKLVRQFNPGDRFRYMDAVYRRLSGRIVMVRRYKDAVITDIHPGGIFRITFSQSLTFNLQKKDYGRWIDDYGKKLYLRNTRNYFEEEKFAISPMGIVITPDTIGRWERK